MAASSSNLSHTNTGKKNVGDKLDEDEALEIVVSETKIMAASSSTVLSSSLNSQKWTQFQAPFLGFTKTAEIWNSRACMIGIILVFIVELILNKGILQVIGVDVGKALDLPL